MTYKTLIIIIVSIFLVFGCQSNKIEKNLVEPRVVSPKQKTDLEKTQEKLLTIHNTERSLRGLNLLILDKDLCEYAQKHSEKMVEKDSLYHAKMKDLMKVKKDLTVVGENIAWGQKDENTVVNDWMYSPFHRWNILGESYRRVGFGVAKDKNGENYWCAVFSN